MRFTIWAMFTITLMVSANIVSALEVTLPPTRFETLECKLYHTEFGGVITNHEELMVDDVFEFSEEGVRNDDMLLIHLNPEVISYKWVDNIVEVYFNSRWDRLMILHTELPLLTTPKTEEIIITIVDVVKLKEGYNYYINKHKNCKRIK